MLLTILAMAASRMRSVSQTIGARLAVNQDSCSFKISSSMRSRCTDNSCQLGGNAILSLEMKLGISDVRTSDMRLRG